MRNLIFTALLMASAFCASAQKVYFIYLQSENYNPFYVKMSDKIYSSATSGYLILSNLVDSTYNFSIGFPSSSSESRFAVTLGAKDRGFIIKNSGSILFDLQSLSTIDAQKDESLKNISYIKRNDSFSSLLSKAANDTSLLYAMVKMQEDVAVQKEQPKTEQSKQQEETTLAKPEESIVKDSTSAKTIGTDIAAQTSKPDTIAVAQTSTEPEKQNAVINTSSKEESVKDTVALVEQKEPEKQMPAQSAEDTMAVATTDTVAKKVETAIAPSNAPEETQTFKRSKIKKHSESSTSEGFGLVFYDTYEGGKDTIRLIIPNPPFNLKTSTQDTSLQQKDFIHVEDLQKDTVKQTQIVAAEKTNTPVKSHCKSLASNIDFFKLRKNMAAENTDEAMVDEAKKFFKNKCFTTEQIKNLSTLFLTSAGKYLFFDAAYLHISDQANFSSLESEIKDDYYLKRFKALVGE